jgi:hypothetical protein
VTREEACPSHTEEVARLLRGYFDDPEVYTRGLELRHCAYDAEQRQQIAAMQRYVCGKYLSNSLTVEANLSSNFVILGLERLQDHPLYRWTVPGEDLNLGFSVSLNTDNPSIFNTRLEVEYALAFHGALARGLARDQAADLVERLRKSSLESTFVRRSFRTEDGELEHLCRTIACLKRCHELSATQRFQWSSGTV